MRLPRLWIGRTRFTYGIVLAYYWRGKWDCWTQTLWYR